MPSSEQYGAISTTLGGHGYAIFAKIETGRKMAPRGDSIVEIIQKYIIKKVY